jgi:hypothetical protein
MVLEAIRNANERKEREERKRSEGRKEREEGAGSTRVKQSL